MDLATILPWIQIAVSVVMVTLILLQSTGEGGLGSAFGGGDGAGYHTRRGMERMMFIGTIVCAILFGALGVLWLFLAAA